VKAKQARQTRGR